MLSGSSLVTMGFIFRYLPLLGLVLTFFCFLLVQSQQVQPQFQSPPPPPSPLLENTPPPPPISFDSDNTQPQFNTPPPPPSQFKVELVPPISPPPIPKSPPSPREKASPPQSNSTGSHSRNQQPERLRPPSPPPSPSRVFKQSEKSGLNTGKTVGLVFAGFAVMLQICIAAFLIIKRKQLLKMTHAH